jgi:hypothetical protein
MILSKNLSRRLSWPARVAVLLGAVAVLPLSPMSLRGDDEAGSKTITIEIKKGGSVSVSVGPPASKQVTAATSAVSRSLQYIARVQPEGGMKIEQAGREKHVPITLRLQSKGAEVGLEGAVKIVNPVGENTEGSAEKTKAGEAQKSLELTASGLLLELAGNEVKVKQLPPQVSLEFSNDQQGKGETEWKHVIADEINAARGADKTRTADAQIQFTNAQQAVSVQAAASHLIQIHQKEAELQQLNAQLKALQAELELLRAQAKEQKKGPEAENPGKQ